MTESTMQQQPSALDKPLWAAPAWDWEKTAYLIIIALAVVSRFYDLGLRVISHDESLHAYYSYELYKGKGYVHTPLMHGTIQFHLVGLTYALFGASDFTARVPSALFGVAAVALMWFFRRWLGKAGAMLAAVFMAISPYMLYYSRYVRNELFVVVWGLLMALALFNYMERREARWLYGMVAATSLLYTTKEVSYIYVATWMLFLGLIFLREMFVAEWPNPRYRRLFTGAVYVALLAGAVGVLLLVLGPRMASQLNATATALPANPTAAVTGAAAQVDPYKQGGLIAFGAAAALFLAAGLMSLLAFKKKLRDFAVVDLLVVLGTFVLPQLTAFPVKYLLKADPLDYSWPGLLKTSIVFIPLFLLSVGIGLAWDWRKWLVAAGVFYGIFVPLFTTMFTNGGGFASGMVGSLGYWLDQQSVNRGSQPWYYYLFVLLPLYEYLPLIGGLTAAGIGLWRFFKSDTQTAGNVLEVDTAETPTHARHFPALLFTGYWVVMALLAYSIAGEKMPWLTVHITLPLILLAGWAAGQIVEAIDWKAFRKQLGWAAALVAPLTLYGILFALAQLLGATPPFQGNTLEQLQATMSFIMALLFVIGGAVGMYFLSRRLAWRQIGLIVSAVAGLGLALLTARTAIYAAYINYDDQTEFINYASGAPGVKTVMSQVAEISQRTTDGLGIKVAYDDDVSWPMTWYMRDFTGQAYYGGQPTRETFQDAPLVIAGGSNWGKAEPLLGKRYNQFEYIRMWWPMQEYFNLTPERVKTALTDPNYRQALFNIWFYRDYKKYGELTNVDYSLSRWPVSDRMRLYIRKDVAAQMWSLGVGPTVLEPAPEDPYAKNKLALAADRVWGASGAGDDQFNSPRAVAVGPDGSVYVADTRGNRIEQFTADGQFVRAWGGLGKLDDNTAGPGLFNEVWGLAVDKDGFVYASDTWNHRIQKFTADGQFVQTWGVFGLADAGLNAMWGPRGVAVDNKGQVFVADTGNKRILVFTTDGVPVQAIGAAGVLDGQLDEPTDVAVAEDGRLFVADTWNQRVQVFAADGAYSGQWEIAGWYGQSLDNKPYLALDGSGNVYVSDPEGYRIIVFNSGGQFQYTFGDFGSDDSTFALPVGVAFADNNLYVADANNDRVMRFAIQP
ncbi:MAG: TIGR03663 family protein [Chloroflexi bacterium]|nr:TIGR03663 family protein [Chloroflexota bacterium]